LAQAISAQGHQHLRREARPQTGAPTMADDYPETQLEPQACAAASEASSLGGDSEEAPLVVRVAASGRAVGSWRGMRAASLSLAALLAAALLAVIAHVHVGKASGTESPPGPRAGAWVGELVERQRAAQCLPEEHGVDYLATYGKALTNLPGANACRSKCLSILRCTTWTWVSETGMPGAPRQCWVKSGPIESAVRRVPPNGRKLDSYVSGCIAARLAGALDASPYALNYQADHAEGEVPGLGCGAPGPLPAIQTAELGSSAPVQVSVLTYNLAWWSVFDKGRAGELFFHQATPGNAAIRLINQTVAAKGIDVMGFQECNNIVWLLHMTGLATSYTGIQGPEGVCIAFKRTDWTRVEQGDAVVGEDARAEYWGRRVAHWVRLVHRVSGKPLFVMNHHGPLPIGSGGVCGPERTVRRLLSMIAVNAHRGEPVLLTGDFNAGQASPTIRLLKTHLNSVASGAMSNGIDNIFSNLPPSSVLGSTLLGTGGSDHNALRASLWM